MIGALIKELRQHAAAPFSTHPHTANLMDRAAESLTVLHVETLQQKTDATVLIDEIARAQREVARLTAELAAERARCTDVTDSRDNWERLARAERQRAEGLEKERDQLMKMLADSCDEARSEYQGCPLISKVPRG